MTLRDEIAPLVPTVERIRSCGYPVFLYGMGNGAEKMQAYLKQNGVKIAGVVASEGFLRGQSFAGFEVISIRRAEELFGKLCLVLCFGLEGRQADILKPLYEKHLLVSPNLPVYGEGACDYSAIIENEKAFSRIYDSLYDGLSRDIFLSLLKYNASGDIKYLAAGETDKPPQEYYMRGGRHIEVGSYDGKTALEFAGLSKADEIIAFEPDKKSFRRLCLNTASEKRIIPVNAAVGERDCELAFSSRASRASSFGAGDTVGCVSVDGFCGNTSLQSNGKSVESIRIDAEGMDEQVLCGAANTIYKYKSNVCVALYHRAFDLLEIPKLLLRSGVKYKFYLRKKEYVPAWDVFLYAVSE